MGENNKTVAAAGKHRMHLFPPGVRAAVVRVLEHGADKYGPFNYREGETRATLYYDAACRHLDAWLSGENTDPETGQPHITHAIAGLVVLLDAYHAGVVIDDRPPTTREHVPALNVGPDE